MVVPFHMNRKIFSTFELLVTETAGQRNMQMSSLDMFVHVGCPIAGVVAVRAGPGLLPKYVHRLQQLVLYNTVQVCSKKRNLL